VKVEERENDTCIQAQEMYYSKGKTESWKEIGQSVK
jgi:hypothetical protein